MKFGQISAPEEVDFTLPEDHVLTKNILSSINVSPSFKINIGLPRWAKDALPGFYPKGTKNELAYYAKYYNAIELNAFYYRIFKPAIVEKWQQSVGSDFAFFPKIPQLISQFRGLKNCENELNDYFRSIAQFKDNLGGCFLQMNESFAPTKFTDLENFITQWPSDVPLFVELRHELWFSDGQIFKNLTDLLAMHKVGLIITDTAGRRDLLHMALTIPKCFVRFTGSNHSSDIERVMAWYERLAVWRNAGINEINFFIHQHIEKDLPLLSAILMDKMNLNWNTSFNPSWYKSDHK